MELNNGPFCPRCAHPLLEFTHQDIRIDECSRCEGIWLDSGEIGPLMEQPERLLWSPELNMKWERGREWIENTPGAVKADLFASHRGHCPRCEDPLHVEHMHGIDVDRCGTCNGVWLDKGELALLAGSEPGLVTRLLKRLFG